MSLVKVKLSQNQLGALTDFEFNVGRDKFAHSTLLRKLNAGNYSGASISSSIGIMHLLMGT